MINRLMWLLWIICRTWSVLIVTLVEAIPWVLTGKQVSDKLEDWWKLKEPKL